MGFEVREVKSEIKKVSLFFLPTATHWPEGTPPSEGGVLCARWAEPNYPSVINKPAATRLDASDKFMTEAISMGGGGGEGEICEGEPRAGKLNNN